MNENINKKKIGVTTKNIPENINLFRIFQNNFCLTILNNLKATIIISAHNKIGNRDFLKKIQEIFVNTNKIAITISIILTFVWLITFSTYTTQTDYSTIDEALIESGLIEDKSHLLYVSSLLVWLILMVCFLIQVVVFYFVIEMLKKSKAQFFFF